MKNEAEEPPISNLSEFGKGLMVILMSKTSRPEILFGQMGHNRFRVVKGFVSSMELQRLLLFENQLHTTLLCKIKASEHHLIYVQ